MNRVSQEVAVCLDVFAVLVIMALIITLGSALPLQIILAEMDVKC